ncbi:MHYT domain-containing protein [Nocardioides sp.]|uniref:MHYT domain-containing protein n=1 Tax=Nocardioides sp. TaxID=35761 RepID=UPI0039E47052
MPEYTISASSFDPALVALSFLISVFGAWCGLTCASRARDRHGAGAFLWLLAGAVAIGGGAVWSMHFIGMLAYNGHVAYRLDVPITLVSLLAVIVGGGLGIGIAWRLHNVVGYVVGGLLVGAGVGVMHYLGMYAMQMNAEMAYRPAVVGISLVIAFAASVIALFFTLNVRSTLMRGLASLIMGVGVCAMHYTGMFALMVRPDLTKIDVGLAAGADPFTLAMPIFGLSAVLLFVLLFAGMMDEASGEAEIPAAEETRPEPSFR